MHEDTRIQYGQLARLGDAAVNAAMLAQLEGKSSEQAQMLRANLLRRSGDLAAARAILIGDDEKAIEELAIPGGLTTQPDNFIAPLIVIDDLLAPEDMAKLYRHACEREAHFKKARLSSGDRPYDPDKRETLLDWHFTVRREWFLAFIEENVARFQQAMGLPGFAITKSEIKLTNHLEGGFFNTHRDNHNPPNEAGRALTWLYYFGDETPRFTGGELFVFDSNFAKGQISDSFFTKVVPRPNRFVAFPSWFYHAVGSTQVPGNAFADGRFAVSGHVSKGEDTARWPGL